MMVRSKPSGKLEERAIVQGNCLTRGLSSATARIVRFQFRARRSSVCRPIDCPKQYNATVSVEKARNLVRSSRTSPLSKLCRNCSQSNSTCPRIRPSACAIASVENKGLFAARRLRWRSWSTVPKAVREYESLGGSYGCWIRTSKICPSHLGCWGPFVPFRWVRSVKDIVPLWISHV